MKFLEKFYDCASRENIEQEKILLGYNEFCIYFVEKYGFKGSYDDILIQNCLKNLNDESILGFIQLALRKQKQETDNIAKNTEEKIGRTMWDIYIHVLENKKYPSWCTVVIFIFLAFIWHIIAYPDIIDILKNILYCK